MNLIIRSGEISSINSKIIPSYILHQINVTFFKDVTGIILFKCLSLFSCGVLVDEEAVVLFGFLVLVGFTFLCS